MGFRLKKVVLGAILVKQFCKSKEAIETVFELLKHTLKTLFWWSLGLGLVGYDGSLFWRLEDRLT